MTLSAARGNLHCPVARRTVPCPLRPDLPLPFPPHGPQMYCTGGIRCDIYSTVLRQRGYQNLYTLEGGIQARAPLPASPPARPPACPPARRGHLGACPHACACRRVADPALTHGMRHGSRQSSRPSLAPVCPRWPHSPPRPLFPRTPLHHARVPLHLPPPTELPEAHPRRRGLERQPVCVRRPHGNQPRAAWRRDGCARAVLRRPFAAPTPSPSCHLPQRAPLRAAVPRAALRACVPLRCPLPPHRPPRAPTADARPAPLPPPPAPRRRRAARRRALPAVQRRARAAAARQLLQRGLQRTVPSVRRVRRAPAGLLLRGVHGGAAAAAAHQAGRRPLWPLE